MVLLQQSDDLTLGRTSATPLFLSPVCAAKDSVEVHPSHSVSRRGAYTEDLLHAVEYISPQVSGVGIIWFPLLRRSGRRYRGGDPLYGDQTELLSAISPSEVAVSRCVSVMRGNR